MKKVGHVIIMGALLLFTLPASNALALVNPGFETGDTTGWDEVGRVAVRDFFQGTFPPPDGDNHAMISTNTRPGNPLPAASLASLESFLGVDLNAVLGIDDLNDGSAIKQSYTTTGDSIQHMDLAFAFRTGDPTDNDAFFVLIDGQLEAMFRLSDVIGDMTHNAGNFGVTDYLPLDIAVSAGLHELAIGVVNVDSGRGRSVLLVDSVLVDSVLPEPATAALAFMSIGALMFSSWRRRP